MIIRILLSTCCGLLFILITGCSSGHNSPVLPGSSSSVFPVGVSDYFPDGTPQSGTGTLGLFSVHIDPIKLNGEISPFRNTSLEDVLEVVDITNFLQIAPCFDCVKLHSVAINADENLVLSIGIRHPFPTGDPEKPISGQNRGDLHIFNIEGYIIADGTSQDTFTSLGQTVGNFKLINADGFSPYLDPSWDEFLPTIATIHPYITHFDDYSQGNFDPTNPMGFDSVTDPPPSGNLVMPMGSSENTQNYILDIPLDSPIDFMFAVGCTYAVSASSKSERFSPEYRIPQHNKKAASEVSVEIITNDLAVDDPLSSATLHVNVVDISHGISVGTALNEMLADSSVSIISVEIPGVTLTPVNLTSPVPISGSGHDPTDPLVFEINVTNSAQGLMGRYNGLTKVLDSCSPGLNTIDLLNSMDGIKRVGPVENPLDGLFAISEFATYQTFSIDVIATTDPPTAILLSTPDPANIQPGQTVDFDGTTSYDTDGTVDLYEFDFDWDGFESNFTADESNTTGLVTSPPYNSEGNFTAGLRVNDNMGAVGYDSVPVDVSTVPNIPPVADLSPGEIEVYEGHSILFDATDSYDTDGSITLYEFDFDWDEVEMNFVADSSNTTGIVYSDLYMDSGTFTAGVRVTDNNNDVDYDLSTVTVSAGTPPDVTKLIITTVRQLIETPDTPQGETNPCYFYAELPYSSEVQALRLDWPEYTGADTYDVYRHDPFSGSAYTRIAQDLSDNYYIDTNIDNNEGYEYYVDKIGTSGSIGITNHALALLEDAEDNSSTNSVWQTESGVQGTTSPKNYEWGICNNFTANGYGRWSFNGISYTARTACATNAHIQWSWSILCSPVIPIPSDPETDTAYVEFNVLVNMVQDFGGSNQSSGGVGVAQNVSNLDYYPSIDFREGWKYNIGPDNPRVQHHTGLSYIHPAGANFPNCISSNDHGYGGRMFNLHQEDLSYYYAAYNLSSGSANLLSGNQRVSFSWGSQNTSWTPCWYSYDDIAIIVY